MLLSHIFVTFFLHLLSPFMSNLAAYSRARRSSSSCRALFSSSVSVPSSSLLCSSLDSSSDDHACSTKSFFRYLTILCISASISCISLCRMFSLWFFWYLTKRWISDSMAFHSLCRSCCLLVLWSLSFCADISMEARCLIYGPATSYYLKTRPLWWHEGTSSFLFLQ